jgi:uncharacterized protein YraI
MIAVAGLVGGCSTNDKASDTTVTPEQRNAAIVAIAQQFAATQDVEAAKVALDVLNLPDQPQAVLALAESYIAQGSDEQTTLELVGLAKALGPISRMASDYLAQQRQASAVAVVAEAVTPTLAPTDTPVAPTHTPEQTATSTAMPSPEPTATTTPTVELAPLVVAKSETNLRRGPGTAYPLAGSMDTGEQADVLGRNADGTWWQVALADGAEGWVNAELVTANDAVEGVAIVQIIPTLAPTNTPPPAPPTEPPAPAATATPKPAPPPGTPYVVKSLRARPLGQDAQTCGGGEHNIFVKVVDPAGNPLDGVRVREVFTGIVHVSGEKGPGQVDFDIYMDGGGQVDIVDDGNTPLSPKSRGMSANLPDWDLFLEAGYCNCKPYPDVDSCRAGWEARDFRYMPNTHYVYEVVFQRTY